MAASVRNTAIKRIQGDVREMMKDPSDQYAAAPLETNMFDWHFTLRGPRDTEFEGGMYHGRILLPSDYPFKPPNIMLLTPNGRFEVKKKICLSISAHHPEEWQPAWGVRLILEALISFMPTKGEGAIGALDFPAAERKRLAKLSVDYKCETCGRIADLLPELEHDEEDEGEEEEGAEGKKAKDAKPSKYAAQIAQLHMHSLESGSTGNDKKQEASAVASSSGNDEAEGDIMRETGEAAGSQSTGNGQKNPATADEKREATEEAPSSASSADRDASTSTPASMPPAASTPAPAAAPVAPAAAPAPRQNVDIPQTVYQERESGSVDVFLHYLTVAIVVALFALVYKKLLQMHGVLQ